MHLPSKGEERTTAGIFVLQKPQLPTSMDLANTKACDWPEWFQKGKFVVG